MAASSRAAMAFSSTAPTRRASESSGARPAWAGRSRPGPGPQTWPRRLRSRPGACGQQVGQLVQGRQLVVHDRATDGTEGGHGCTLGFGDNCETFIIYDGLLKMKKGTAQGHPACPLAWKWSQRDLGVEESDLLLVVMALPARETGKVVFRCGISLPALPGYVRS